MPLDAAGCASRWEYRSRRSSGRCYIYSWAMSSGEARERENKRPERSSPAFGPMHPQRMFPRINYELNKRHRLFMKGNAGDAARLRCDGTR